MRYLVPPGTRTSQMPAALSTGMAVAGIAHTAMGALAALQNGQPIQMVITDIMAPIVPMALGADVGLSREDTVGYVPRLAVPMEHGR
jgi:hypothetical protein